jgi:hypothetical protein
MFSLHVYIYIYIYTYINISSVGYVQDYVYMDV